MKDYGVGGVRKSRLKDVYGGLAEGYSFVLEGMTRV